MLTIDPPRATLGSLLRRLRRRVLAHRRLLAFVLATAAVLIGLQAARPAPPPRETLTVAARDLPAGTLLTAADLARVRVPPEMVPDGLARSPVGETLATDVRRGEPLTDVRLVRASMTESHPGVVALPLRLPDAGMVDLLHVGDRVDLLSTDPTSGEAGRVAEDALVLTLPQDTQESADDVRDTGRGGSSVMGAVPGRLVVVGVRSVEVAAVSAAQVQGYLTYTF